MRRITVESVVLVSILSNLVAFTLAMILTLPPLWRLARSVSARWVGLVSLRQNLRYGLSAQIGTLEPFSGLRLDVLALTVLSATHDLGLYMAALAWANLIRVQGYAIGQVVLPEVAKRGDRTEQWRIIRCFMLLVGVVGGGRHRDVRRNVSATFRVWRSFCVGSANVEDSGGRGCGGGDVPDIGRRCSGHGQGAGYFHRGELTGVSCGIVALVLLVPEQGATGAAWAVLIAFSMSFASAVWLANRHLSHTHPVHKGELW